MEIISAVFLVSFFFIMMPGAGWHQLPWFKVLLLESVGAIVASYFFVPGKWQVPVLLLLVFYEFGCNVRGKGLRNALLVWKAPSTKTSDDS